ncbi:MAG TPA: PEP/pyruvate-binding domain-containing protein [Thermoanaerobaculia bacterium]
MQISWLGNQACHDPTRSGRKAAILSRLAAADHPVPPGFCLTALRCFANPAAPTCATLPAPLRGELKAAYERLCSRCGSADVPVAVRSSACDEDGAEASCAGQYESLLNVSGVEAVAEAVIRCWSSATSAHATSYRRERGLPDAASLAVLVQQLVLADVSVVAFSANPVTGERNEVVIEATWGLGASLVGGAVTPDLYTVSRNRPRIIHRRLGEKALMTIRAPGGTREIEVPRVLRDRLTLSDGQAIEVADLAEALEKRTRHPVDLECAYSGDRLYLLQCRPITSLP